MEKKEKNMLTCKGCMYEERDGETLDEVVERLDKCMDCRRMFLEHTDEYKIFKDMYTKGE